MLQDIIEIRVLIERSMMDHEVLVLGDADPDIDGADPSFQLRRQSVRTIAEVLLCLHGGAPVEGERVVGAGQGQ